MDQETLRLRALAAATARRLSAKKVQKLQESKQKNTQDPPPKRRRFTFSDEPNAPNPPLLPLETAAAGDAAAAPETGAEGHWAPVEFQRKAGCSGPRVPKLEPGHHWYRAAMAAEEAKMAENEGIAESYTLVEVPDDLTGLLIGKHGSGIKSLQDQTAAVLCVGKLAVEGMRKVCITGSPESQEAAKALIANFVARQEEQKKHQEQQVVAEVEVPNRFAGRLIGTKGEVIRQLRDAYGIRAQLDDKPDEPVRKFELRGHWQQVESAKQHVELLLLHLFRKFKIYNAPLERKYSNTSLTQMSRAGGVMTMTAQQEIGHAALLHPWAAHFAGNLDCISMFENRTWRMLISQA